MELNLQRFYWLNQCLPVISCYYGCCDEGLQEFGGGCWVCSVIPLNTAGKYQQSSSLTPVSPKIWEMEAGDSIYLFSPHKDWRHTIFSKLEGSLCLASVSTRSMLTQPAKTVRLSGGVTSSLRREWSALRSASCTVWGLGIQVCIHTAIFEWAGSSFASVQTLTPPTPHCALHKPDCGFSLSLCFVFVCF